MTTKNKEFVFNLKNLEDVTEEFLDKIADADKVISDCELKASITNDGIGHYEFWGHTGFDKGVTYLELEYSESFDLKLIVEDGIPEGTSIKDLEEILLDNVSCTRKVNKGSNERSDGYDAELKLSVKNPVIEGNTFSCTVTWEDIND